jgi:hypothetical protein
MHHRWLCALPVGGACFWQSCSIGGYTVSYLIYVSLICVFLYNNNGPRMSTTLKAQLTQFDEEHELLRQVTIPEEDRAKYTSAQWSGEYRWFRSPNVICLEKVRRLKAKPNV